jgi:histidinol-phosphate aminotransferase
MSAIIKLLEKNRAYEDTESAMPSITHLIRPEIADLEPYVPIVPLDVLAQQLGLPIEQIVKLDANENPYGASPRALEALAREPHYAIYPDPEHRSLRAALSAYTGQPAERIVCGAGADELIDLLLRLLLCPGDAVIDCPPTFGMYAFDTEVCGGQLVSVPRCEDFSLDIAAIEQAAYETNAKVLFVASPNNPSGNTISHTDMERLLELPLLVVVDEAYIEFTAGGVSDWVGRYENLAVLRTFSKWAGLAGLRIGYGLLPEELAREIWKIKQPYNVNLAAQVAALASLEDVAYLRGTIERIVAERERVLAALSAQPGLHVYPSQTNFLLCRVLDGDALHLKQTLAQVGVLVRHYRKSGLSDCLRVSIGRPEQNDRFLAALNVARKRPKEA